MTPITAEPIELARPQITATQAVRSTGVLIPSGPKQDQWSQPSIVFYCLAVTGRVFTGIQTGGACPSINDDTLAEQELRREFGDLQFASAASFWTFEDSLDDD